MKSITFIKEYQTKPNLLNSKTSTLHSILLIDDDHSNNFINTIFINQLGLEIDVNTALNGLEGIQFLKDSFAGPCLIILDIQMPVMDGWAFLDAYDKEIPKEVKEQITIVMITASTDEIDKAKARKNPHVTRFMQKPLSDLKFQRLIKKYF